MKKPTFIAVLIITAAFAAFAQTSDEKAILKFINDYDRAYINKELTFFESVFAPQYTVTVDGRSQNRTEILTELRQQKAESENKILEMKSTNENLRIVGNVAFATGFIEWKSVTGNSKPESGKERYTIVLEKHNGKWMLVSEHISSVKRDRKLMEAEVLKAGQEYNQTIKNKDVAAMEKMLAREFYYTNEEGKIISREEELVHHKNGGVTLEIMEISDRKVRIIGNNAAVETGIFRYKGSQKDKAIEGRGRYTTTWMHRDGVWQIVADHTTSIK